MMRCSDPSDVDVSAPALREPEHQPRFGALSGETANGGAASSSSRVSGTQQGRVEKTVFVRYPEMRTNLRVAMPVTLMRLPRVLP